MLVNYRENNNQKAQSTVKMMKGWNSVIATRNCIYVLQLWDLCCFTSLLATWTVGLSVECTLSKFTKLHGAV